MRLQAICQRPTARGSLAALVKLLPLVVGIFAVVAQLGLTSDIIREPPLHSWDGIQNWHQAQKIRSGEPLYRPHPFYGPHVMAGHMDGHEQFPVTESPHPPLLAAVVALTSLDSVRVYTSVLGVVLLLATWGFASVLAVLAHHRWTLPRFLCWNGLVFLFPGAHHAFQLGNVEPVVWLLFALAIAFPAPLGSGALVLSGAIKPYAVWPLAFLLVRNRDARLGALVSVVVVVAVCVLAMGSVDFVRNVRDWIAFVPAAMGQGTFSHANLSLSFGALRMAYSLGWWDYQPGPIAEVWPRIWLTCAQVGVPLAAGVLTYRWNRRLHLSVVMLAALLFNPLCWDWYLTVSLVPLAVWIGLRHSKSGGLLTAGTAPTRLAGRPRFADHPAEEAARAYANKKDK